MKRNRQTWDIFFLIEKEKWLIGSGEQKEMVKQRKCYGL